MSEPAEPRVIAIDLDVDRFTVAESRLFRAAVGCNPEYALITLQRAVNEGREEAYAAFGERMDEQGWKPPAGWAPSAMLNVDPAYLCGFAWICARRSDPSITYEAMEQSLPMGELMDAFYGALTETIERATKASAPLADRAARRSRQPTPRTTSASKSRGSTTGHSERSTP